MTKCKTKKQNVYCLLFLLPSLLGVMIFIFIPFLDSVRKSFFTAVSEKFIGAKNYEVIMKNDAFALAVKNTALFTAVCIPALIIISFFLSYLITKIKCIRLIKSVLLFPLAIPTAAMVLIWQILFSDNGYINNILVSTGHGSVSFLSSKTAFLVLVGSYIWKNAEVESFTYGTTSHGFKLKGMDAFSIDMDAHMNAGYSIEGGIRKGDTVSGILNINTANNYIYFGDLDVVKYGGEKGDANADGSLDMADVVMIMQALANPNKYGLDGIDGNRITKRGNGLGDMDGNGLTVGDAQAIQMKLLGLGNNSDPLTPTAQPVGVKTTDEAIKLINNYDLNDYDAAYRDSMKEMFESFKKDGYIYCFADAAGEDRIKPDSGIALMPYMRYEDRGVLYHVTYKGEKYQIYYYLRDSRYAEQSFDKYIANRLGFNMTKVTDDKYYILDNSKTGQSDISAFFAIDGENYCKVRGFGTEAELMEFVNALNCVKIPINNKLTTDDPSKYPFEAQYIRVYGTGNYNREPVIEMFNSEEELLSRYNPNSQHEKYDEKWFSDHKLIMITVGEPSGSIRHKVTELTSDYVAIDRITPEVMTCDLAIWHIYIELDKDAVINDDFRAEITETKSFDA